MALPRPCPSCGAAVGADSMFCAACGHVLTVALPSALPSAFSPAPEKKPDPSPVFPPADATLLGVPFQSSGPEKPPAIAPHIPMKDLEPRTDQTLLGVPATSGARPPAKPLATSIPAQSDRTLLGSPAPADGVIPGQVKSSAWDESQEEPDYIQVPNKTRKNWKPLVLVFFVMDLIGLLVWWIVAATNPTAPPVVQVRADLEPLSKGEAGFDVVVDAAEDARVTVDGSALQVDAHGHGVLRIPVAITTETAFSKSIRYAVTSAGGETLAGTLDVQIPLARLSVRKPGDGLMTERETIDIEGDVEPGAALRIDGEAVATTEARFSVQRPLVEGIQTCFSLSVHAPKRIPRAQSVCVRRVPSLTEAARAIAVERAPSYERLVSEPRVLSGSHLSVTGRVYNVAENDGRSALQILSDDCPRGSRCPLWITFPNGTPIENDTRIRAIGTFVGEKRFRTANGEELAVPQIDAALVMPARDR